MYGWKLQTVNDKYRPICSETKLREPVEKVHTGFLTKQHATVNWKM